MRRELPLAGLMTVLLLLSACATSDESAPADGADEEVRQRGGWYVPDMAVLTFYAAPDATFPGKTITLTAIVASQTAALVPDARLTYHVRRIGDGATVFRQTLNLGTLPGQTTLPPLPVKITDGLPRGEYTAIARIYSTQDLPGEVTANNRKVTRLHVQWPAAVYDFRTDKPYAEGPIESMDEGPSFSITPIGGGITANLSSGSGDLNQEAGGFGVDSDEGAKKSLPDDADGIDRSDESITITFSDDVKVLAIRVSGLDSGEVGRVTFAKTQSVDLVNSGETDVGGVLLSKGSAMRITLVAGNGFSLDAVRVEPVQ